MIFAAIVASVRPRTGKTLLARLLAENFILAGARPSIFDTDTNERTLRACFPGEAVAIDLDKVTDQMTLFDSLVQEGAHSRVVEIAHRSYKKFFDLMQVSDLAAEARARGIEPVVFYIPGTDPDSFEFGRQLREQIGDCPFVVTENAQLGEVRSFTKLSVGYRALEPLRPRIQLAALDPQYVSAVEDPALSYSDFIREPPADLPFEARDAIRTWLLRGLRQVYGALHHLEQGRFHDHQPPRREGSV